MSLDLALVISGDASGARQAVEQTSTGVRGLGNDAKQMSAAMQAANDQAAASSRAATEALIGQTTAQRNLQAAVASFAGVRQPTDDAGYRQRAADIAAYGAGLDQLRAKYNPLYAAEVAHLRNLAEIDRALKVGALTETEHADAVRRAAAAYELQVAGLDQVAGRALAAKLQLEEFSRMAAQARDAQRADAAQLQVNQLLGVRDPNAMAGSARASAAAFLDMPDDAPKNIALASHEMTNLTFQMNDIVMMLASGQSPFTMMMQQGSQVTQILGQRGLGEVLPAIGSALTSLISPTTLFLAGITAAGYAGYYAFRMIVPEARETEDVLQSLTDATRELEDALKRAEKGGRDMARGISVPVARTLADMEADQAREQLIAGGRQIFGDVMGSASFMSQILPKELIGRYQTLGPIYDAVMQLNEEAKNGVPNIERYQRSLSNIAGDSSVADSIRERAGELLKESGILAQLYRDWAAYTNRLDEARQRGPLIGGEDELARNKYLDDQRNAIRDAQRQFEADMLGLTARSPQERAAAARASEAARDVAGENDDVRRDRIELSGKRALIEAEHELAEAQKERLRALDETLAGARLDAELVGKSSAEVARLRMEHELLAEVRREAAANNVQVDEAEIQRIRKVAAEVGKLRALQEGRDLLRSQQEDMLRLRVEQQLVGTSDAMRERTLAQLEAERSIRQIGLDPNGREAEGIRRNAVALADMTLELERQAGAWDMVRSAGEQAIDSFIDKLSEGDWKGALKALGDDIFKTALQLNVANPLKNWIFGGNNPTGMDLGAGVLNRLFGGADAGAASAVSSLFGGQSVGAMSVNAGSVIVTGSIGVGGGLGGLMQNVTRLLSGGNDNTAGGDVASRIWSFFSGKGLADHQVAGIMGNIGAESDFNPSALNPSSGAFGLFQHLGSRLTGLGAGADLGRQLEYAWQELQTSEAGVLRKLLSATDVRSATGAFAGFERAEGWSRANPEGIALWERRLDTAQQALDRFSGTTGSAAQGVDALGKGATQLGSGLNQFGNALSQFPAAPAGGGGGLGGLLSGLLGIGGGNPSLSPAAWAVVSSGGMTGLFDTGGWTGSGGKFEPAGIVHREEYVFSSEATRAIGVRNLDALHNAARRGFAEGGFAWDRAGTYGATGGSSPAWTSQFMSSRPAVVRLIVEEGPMFRTTIRTESEDVAVEVVRATEVAREDRYQNGAPR